MARITACMVADVACNMIGDAALPEFFMFVTPMCNSILAWCEEQVLLESARSFRVLLVQARSILRGLAG